MNATLGRGLHDLPAAIYHADPAPAPSLSHSVARIVIDKSPLHAFLAHPRLGMRETEKDGPTRDMALGTAVHALALGKGVNLAIIDAEDYRTKAAKEARDLALASGRTPILATDHLTATVMATSARAAIEAFVGVDMEDMLVEQTMLWQDGDAEHWRRAMFDAALPDLSLVIDLKTTDSAEPRAAARKLFSMGYDTQEAFYRRGLNVLDPSGARGRRFIFAVQEREPPYPVTLHELDEASRDIAAGEIRRAVALWDACLSENRWPIYARGPHAVTPPAWRVAQEMNERIAEDILSGGAQ